MKKILFAVVGALSFTGVSFAKEDAAYCQQKCSPDHCKAYPTRAAMCKTDCPDDFDACYAAVPDAKKPSVDQLIKDIEAALAKVN